MGEPITLYGKNGETREVYGLAAAQALTAGGVWHATAEAAQAAGKGDAAVTEPVEEPAPPAPDKPTQRKGAKS